MDSSELSADLMRVPPPPRPPWVVSGGVRFKGVVGGWGVVNTFRRTHRKHYELILQTQSKSICQIRQLSTGKMMHRRAPDQPRYIRVLARRWATGSHGAVTLGDVGKQLPRYTSLSARRPSRIYRPVPSVGETRTEGAYRPVLRPCGNRIAQKWPPVASV